MKNNLFYLFMLLFSVQAFAQEQTVTGIVTDAADGSALPGVNVLIKGTVKGVSTDFDGNYTIELSGSEETTLVFSFIGFKDQVIAVNGQSTINVALEEDANELDEVVVVGYGTVTKKEFQGAAVSLGTDEMTSGAATVSAAQMIQGRASGVEVSASDGEPGQGMKITIRGTTSISNDTQPLYVVDGFPIAAGVTIPPEDIETIDILKDAASAAIYGSRGSSGVVLITTKKGKNGRTEISYDGYTGIQQLNGSINYIDWQQSYAIANEQHAQFNSDGLPFYDEGDLKQSRYNNTDWLEATTRDAVVQSHTIRASGGSDKSHFSLSGGYFDQEGIMLNTSFQRMTLRVNADHKFGEKTKIGVNMSVARVHANSMDKRGGARDFSPLFGAMNTVRGKRPYNYDGTLGDMKFSRESRDFVNPVGLLELPTNNTSAWRTYANVFVDHQFTEHLTGRINAGFDYFNELKGKYEPVGYSSAAGTDVARIDNSSSQSYLLEGTLNYTRDIGDNHSFGLLVGASRQYDNSTWFYAGTNQNLNPKLLYYDLISAEAYFVNSNRSDATIVSAFTRANYSYKGKYLFTATVRADGASPFGENNKWGYFPSGSGAWRISDEDFLMDSDLVSDLKLRASYGITGNNRIQRYSSLARVGGTNQATMFDGVSSVFGLGLAGSLAPNPDLKWETTAMLNFGLDFGFWNDRLYGSVEVYHSKTSDLVIQLPTSIASTGFPATLANVGEMENKGIELTLGGTIIDGDSFKWTANANISTNENEITKLDGNNSIKIDIPRGPTGGGAEVYREIIVGGKVTDILGYKYIGVLQQGEKYLPQPNSTEGMALYEDVNGDGMITPEDRTVIGNANPDFIWGFNNHFEFRGIYLDVFWQGVVGNDLLNFKAVSLDRTLTDKAADRYSLTTHTGTRPGPGYFFTEYGSYVNTAFIEDASYIRLKNLSLGYTVPTKSIDWINNLNVYLQGQNLLTFTDYTGLDPEVSFDYGGEQSSTTRGVDDYGVPNYKTFTIGLKASF